MQQIPSNHKRRKRGGRPTCSPSVLEPDLDLLGLDVAEDGAVPDDLLAAEGAGLGLGGLGRKTSLLVVPGLAP